MAQTKHERRQSIINYLVNCSFHELIGILKEALPLRAESVVSKGDLGRQRDVLSERGLTLALAKRVARTKDIKHSRHVNWEPWHVPAVIAYPDEGYSEDMVGYPPDGRQGHCSACGMPVAGHVKFLVCSVCDAQIHVY